MCVRIIQNILALVLFVNNVNEYLIASNIQIGKAGANALMESIYLHRPCIVSDLLYAARATKDFFSENKVGWCEGKVSKQVDIVEACFKEPDFLEKVETHYSNLPLEFGADKFAKQIKKDTVEYYERIK